ncbi:MAG: hypothetical protein IKK77_01765 [Clostridia bacterium]|nr:hypothetical protein [Clostridia bacterium]
MADYKKKQIKHKVKPKSVKKTHSAPQDIKMGRAKPATKKQTKKATQKVQKPKRPVGFSIPEFNIIKGKKLEKIKKNAFSVIVIIVLLCIYLIVCTLHPVGLVEYLTHCYARIGSGRGYEISITGGETLNTVQKSNYYYVLSENNLEAYNNGGRNIFSVQHGFSRPVLKTGDTRFLVYSQGEKVLKVHTFNGLRHTYNLDNSILTANISKSGAIAIATKTEGYESKVTVYNKNDKKLYEWFSTDETVTSVCLNDSGKRLAVATVKVSGGAFVSKIYILKFNSANPVKTFEFNGEIIYNLNNSGGNNIYAVFEKRIEFINVLSGKKKENSSDYSLNIAKRIGNHVITVNTLDANKSESNIFVYTLGGSLVANFEVNGTISDVSMKNRRLHLLTDSGVVITDMSGKLLSKAQCSFDVKNIIALSDKSVVGISNNLIDKYLYEQMEEK